jgi:hypothetical protein
VVTVPEVVVDEVTNPYRKRLAKGEFDIDSARRLDEGGLLCAVIVSANAKSPSAKSWQTFGRLRFESNQSTQPKRDCSNRISNLYGVKKDYGLSEMTGDDVDTVGVWGSNPHAPTNFLQ